MSKTTIPTGGITDGTIATGDLADDAVSEEHLDATAITGSTELAATPADTDEILISDAGTLKRIDFSHIKSSNSPSFSVHASNTNISDASETTIVFDTEIFDSDSAFASNTFSVPSGAGGKYLLSANCQVAGGATDAVRDAILRIKNGSTTIAQSTLGFQSNRQETLTLNFTGIFDLSASDALTCTITIDNVGGTSNYLGGSDRDTSFHGFKLA